MRLSLSLFIYQLTQQLLGVVQRRIVELVCIGRRNADMTPRMPESVSNAFFRMPPEPPSDHIASDSRPMRTTA